VHLVISWNHVTAIDIQLLRSLFELSNTVIYKEIKRLDYFHTVFSGELSEVACSKHEGK